MDIIFLQMPDVREIFKIAPIIVHKVMGKSCKAREEPGNLCDTIVIAARKYFATA